MKEKVFYICPTTDERVSENYCYNLQGEGNSCAHYGDCPIVFPGNE